MSKLPDPSQRFRGAGARVIIRRRADPAEAEHLVPGTETALERSGEAIRLVAENFAPGKPQTARRQRSDEKREMFVLPLADQDLVTDDVGAETAQ